MDTVRTWKTHKPISYERSAFCLKCPLGCRYTVREIGLLYADGVDLECPVPDRSRSKCPTYICTMTPISKYDALIVDC
jgi:hypothetical protein